VETLFREYCFHDAREHRSVKHCFPRMPVKHCFPPMRHGTAILPVAGLPLPLFLVSDAGTLDRVQLFDAVHVFRRYTVSINYTFFLDALFPPVARNAISVCRLPYALFLVCRLPCTVSTVRCV
jgi:hypothetical protein